MKERLYNQKNVDNSLNVAVVQFQLTLNHVSYKFHDIVFSHEARHQNTQFISAAPAPVEKFASRWSRGWREAADIERWKYSGNIMITHGLILAHKPTVQCCQAVNGSFLSTIICFKGSLRRCGAPLGGTRYQMSVAVNDQAKEGINRDENSNLLPVCSICHRTQQESCTLAGE